MNEASEPFEHWKAATDLFLAARRRVALTGAGISVSCGIPDFRSDGGLWSRFPPDEYATVDVFLGTPRRAWSFYRELGRSLAGKAPGAAHLALARLEAWGLLDAVVTQNVDGLHRAAGSARVYEVHGNYRELHCIRCGWRGPTRRDHLEDGPVPECPGCRVPVKPDVVLFGEMVREMRPVEELLEACDVLLLVGTSANVFPVGALPRSVQARGGVLMEFNLEATPLTPLSRIHFRGPVEATLPRFAEYLGRFRPNSAVFGPRVC
jgi:NAD-dependent deacetylase